MEVGFDTIWFDWLGAIVAAVIYGIYWRVMVLRIASLQGPSEEGGH
jgi:hypothetical protein